VIREVDWVRGEIVNIQRELMSLTRDATAMIARVNRFNVWGEHFNKRFPATAESHKVLNIGAAAMLFYENEFATISRQATKISTRASEIRSQIENLLN
jgi:hypothetical protein